MGRIDRQRIILAKIQPVQGTDAVPTGAANAILLAGMPKVTPFKANNVPRDLIRSYFGASEQLVGTGYVELTLPVELQGAGTAGTAPPWGVLYRGAGWAETLLAAPVTGTAQAGAAGSVTLAAGASAVDDFYNGMRLSLTGGTGSGQSAQILDYNGTTKAATIGPAWTVNPDATSTYSIGANAAYRPISTALELLSLYYWRAGVQRKLIDCRAKIETMDFGVGARPMASLRVLGIDAGVAAVTNPALTLTGWKTPAVITDPNTGDILIDGVAYPSRGFTVSGGENVGYTPLLGGQAIDITEREITGNLGLDLTAAQVATFDASVKANTLHTFGFQHGLADGYRLLAHGPAMQLLDQSEDEVNGRALEGFATRYLPSAVGGGDDFALIAA
jgi:hypothetical protein